MEALNVHDIKKILAEGAYLVTVVPVKSGCIARFPERKLNPVSPKAIVKYSLNTEGVLVKHKKEETIYQCPDYAHRLCIWADLAKRCRLINYSSSLIDYTDSNGQKVDSIFEAVLKKEFPISAKEVTLSTLVQGLAENKSQDELRTMAKSLGVEEGFEFMFKLCVENH